MATYQSKFTGKEIDAKLDQVGQVASTDVLGGIKVGEGLEITAEGVLNALGGTVGAGGFSYTKINNSRIEGSGTTHVLNDSILNYDLLIIEADLMAISTGNSNRTNSVVIIPETVVYGATHQYRLFCDTADKTVTTWRSDIMFGFSDATTLAVGTNTNGSSTAAERKFGISNVYGLKFGGGGSSSGTKKVTLWEGELRTNDESVTLSDSLENYDFIWIESCTTDKTGAKGAYMTNLLDVNTIKAYNSTGYNMFNSADPTKHWYRVLFNFTNATTLQLIKANVSSTSWINPQISKVIGIKLGGGGSSSAREYGMFYYKQTGTNSSRTELLPTEHTTAGYLGTGLTNMEQDEQGRPILKKGKIYKFTVITGEIYFNSANGYYYATVALNENYRVLTATIMPTTFSTNYTPSLRRETGLAKIEEDTALKVYDGWTGGSSDIKSADFYVLVEEM